MSRVPFELRTLEDLGELCGRLSVDLPAVQDVSCLAEQVPLGHWTAPNRFLAQPMEGADATSAGAPGPLTERKYRRLAKGAWGVIWFEATAVEPDARARPHQLCLTDETADAFARLVEATRRAAEGRSPLLVLQLTHSGRFSRPEGTRRPVIAQHSAALDAQHGIAEDLVTITDDELDRIGARFVHAARLAAQAGFDGVDVKACHRYLFSELLGAHRREGRYGGAYENRTRLVRETVAAIRETAPDVLVTTRMGVYDGLPWPDGWGVKPDGGLEPDLTEPVRLARELSSLGVPMINASVGSPYYNPQRSRPDGGQGRAHPLYGIAQYVGLAGDLQEAVPEVAVASAGCAWLRHVYPHVAAGAVRAGRAAFAGQGRETLAYPHAPRDVIQTGRMDPDKCCITCSTCGALLGSDRPAGCVVRDREVYRPEVGADRSLTPES